MRGTTLLAVALLGCDGCGTIAPGPPRPGPAAEKPADVAAALASHCRQLPPEPRLPNPDYPSPRNSDGTLKRLPPAPPSVPRREVVLRYEDFGPQAMAYRLLGMNWWSWEPGGSFAPGDEFDVRVVVYQGLSRKEVAAHYPTSRDIGDYRLVPRDEALRYLDRNIADLESDVKQDWEDRLRQVFEATRQAILECLPE